MRGTTQGRYYQEYFEKMAFNPEDPLPTLALFLDRSTPIDPEVKGALLHGTQSWTRQFLLPLIRPLMRTMICLIMILKTPFPGLFKSSALLHRLIYWGLRFFVSPEANLLILRHFHIGSEILQFIRDNAGADIPLSPLRPKVLADVQDHMFLKHDINLFNFVIRLNQWLKANGKTLGKSAKLDFSAISDGPFPMESFPVSWHNFIDVETAIEVYTPIFQLLLSDNDFWRASNSLQLDETIGIYVSDLIGDPSRLWRINNKHPLIPLTTLRAGYRLLLHGYSSESLHFMLRQLKRQANG